MFSGCDQHSIESLQVLQNKAARLVTHSPQRTSRKDMFATLQWLTVKQLMFYHSALTTYRVRQSGEPGYLYDILSRDNRQGNIIIPHSNLTLAKKSYCYKGSAEWNELPKSIRSHQQMSKFKSELKKWVFANVQQF